MSKKQKNRTENGEHIQTKPKNKRENSRLEVGAVQGNQCSFGGRISALQNKSQRDYHTRLVQ